MTLIDLLQQYTPIYIALVGIIGLLVGSFLNVVIYRLPVMMQREWHAGWQQFATENAQALDTVDNPTHALPEASDEPFNLAVPRSRCPSCGSIIHAWQNIPILSYLWIGGKCVNCKQPISMRYPLVEALTAILSIICALKFGVTLQALSAIIITWSLIALSGIDFDTQLLPDSITLPLMWLGLLASLVPVFASTTDAIIGAASGYLSLWSVYWAFKIITKKEGMGYGDFKLLAALGAWFGWQSLPIIILLSSLVGAFVGITMIIAMGRDRQIPIPFGPYLAAAGWLAMIMGEQLTSMYFNLYA